MNALRSGKINQICQNYELKYDLIVYSSVHIQWKSNHTWVFTDLKIHEHFRL